MGIRTSQIFQHITPPLHITMFKLLLSLLLITIASAKPSYDKATIISEGPWIADEAWIDADIDNRDPKGIAESLPSPTSLLGRLGNWWTWDRQAVKEGIFKNDNIMIHVGQNLFNFVFTTLAWFTVSQIYSLTAAVNPASTPREMRSISLEQAAEEVLDAITAFENKQKTE